ncbi:tautomerase family protein [Rhizobium jaguaris]|uniref:4-oxalocrotonate tautomerase family protein n=1 Tax=Rhizobium jaguaris TaxID=1312183 RepID=A0A387FNG3_9HYPH|nr:tautomerase family protein [Rhizobium jaguaris]AYG57531.1 4-oxalocrotonate tautomerase family protein [Rhizobium jaguaris]
MPLIRVELFPGRSPELKAEIAQAFTETLDKLAGIKPEATTVMFAEVQPHDWVVAGKPYGTPVTKE